MVRLLDLQGNQIKEFQAHPGTAIPNSERFCAISAISRNIKNHKLQLL